MTTLHILRSEPDWQVRELINAAASGETSQIALYEDDVDYDRLVEELFKHQRAICWW